MRRKCAECGEGKSPQDFSQEQWDATPSVCMECEELLNTSGSEEDVVVDINGRGNEEDAVNLHVQSNISSSSSSNSFPSSADDKLRQQISALRNDFASLVNLTQAKLESASNPAESVEALRKEILALKEHLEERELDYLILTAEKNTLLQTARCQPITPRSQARLRSMGKSRLQAANEAWESFIKDLPQEEVEENLVEVSPGRVQFNEKKNQEYDHGEVVNEVTSDDNSNGNNSNGNNNSNSNNSNINNRAVSEEEAVAQQMRLRASLRDIFAKKNTVDEHLLYKMHTVNFSPLLNSIATTKTKAEEAKQKNTYELRPLAELADDCFERPVAAGLVTEFLSSKECSVLIDAAKHLELKPVSTTFHPSYRNDKRVILWDPNLAAMLWGRVKSLLPKRLSDRWSADWTVLGFGSRISISEYGENTRYAPHQDSEYVENSATESLFSVIVCLQPSEGEGLKGGGEINFVDPTQVHEVKLSVSMRAGEMLLFPHYLWHETSRVTHGTRYEMRLEVLCREVSSEKDDGNNTEEAEAEGEENGGEEGDEDEGENNSESDASETESIDDSELPPLDDTEQRGDRTHYDEEGGEEGGKQGERDVEHEEANGASEEDEGDHTP